MKGNLVYQESGSEKAFKGGISRESTLIQLFRGLSMEKRFKVDIVLVPLVHARFKFEKSS